MKVGLCNGIHPPRISYSQYVNCWKVEADRGEDLGVVCDKIAASEFSELKPTAGFRGRGMSCDLSASMRITRLATAEERALLPGKALEEAHVLRVSIFHYSLRSAIK